MISVGKNINYKYLLASSCHNKNIDMLKKNYDLAMILVSHDLEFVEKYADYVILIDKTIIKEGTPKEVLGSKEFSEVFGSSRKAWV